MPDLEAQIQGGVERIFGSAAPYYHVAADLWDDCDHRRCGIRVEFDFVNGLDVVQHGDNPEARFTVHQDDLLSSLQRLYGWLTQVHEYEDLAKDSNDES